VKLLPSNSGCLNDKPQEGSTAQCQRFILAAAVAELRLEYLIEVGKNYLCYKEFDNETLG